MWECGLKHRDSRLQRESQTVTPYVGVWIETTLTAGALTLTTSLLMWECGLKHGVKELYLMHAQVTPYVGVWIETQKTN